MKTRIREITLKEKLLIGQKRMLLRHFLLYPTGILSEVMDTWDLWQVLTELLPDPQVKKAIMERNGKLVIRPDSGDPVDIICGTYMPGIDNPQSNDTPQTKGVIELLWDAFGGKTNEYGYKVLDSHIGAIYGDSITLDRASQICERLKAKGFASTNVVLGIGSFTYQYNTRDTFGFAMKATYGELTTHEQKGDHGNSAGYRDYVEAREIFKDPITDDGTKKSKKGLLSVLQPDETHKDVWVKDQCTWEEEAGGLLETVFENGVLMRDQTLEDIRQILNSQL